MRRCRARQGLLRTSTLPNCLDVSSAADRQHSAPSEVRQAYFYFGPLTLLIYLVLLHGWLLDIVTSYMLKNQLHATATRSPSSASSQPPVYFSFLFGLGRDLWNPFGMRDRGFFLLFAPLFIWMAFSKLPFAVLFTGMPLMANETILVVGGLRTSRAFDTIFAAMLESIEPPR